jgi:hypothetical protein
LQLRRLALVSTAPTQLFPLFRHNRRRRCSKPSSSNRNSSSALLPHLPLSPAQQPSARLLPAPPPSPLPLQLLVTLIRRR